MLCSRHRYDSGRRGFYLALQPEKHREAACERRRPVEASQSLLAAAWSVAWSPVNVQLDNCCYAANLPRLREPLLDEVLVALTYCFTLVIDVCIAVSRVRFVTMSL